MEGWEDQWVGKAFEGTQVALGIFMSSSHLRPLADEIEAVEPRCGLVHPPVKTPSPRITRPYANSFAGISGSRATEQHGGLAERALWGKFIHLLGCLVSRARRGQ